MPILAASSFKAAIDAYILNLQVRRFSKQSIKGARLIVPRFFAHVATRGVKDVASITEEHVVSWAKLLKAAKTKKGALLTAQTQRSYLTTLVRFFRFMAKRGEILIDPTLDLDMPQVQKLPKLILSEAQAKKLCETPSPYTPVGKRDRAILETLYGTGLRLSECARLELGDIDLQRGAVFVTLGKGRKDRIVPLTEKAKVALDLYLREGRVALAKRSRGTALFLGSSGGRALPSSSIQRIVWLHATAACLPPITTHTLRHTYATHLVRGGASIRHVQKLLGHAALSSTAIYTRVFPKDLENALLKAHPRQAAYNRPRRKRP